MIKHIPYWRLSSFYWFYFATLGALVPYWGLFLADSGFTAIEIGQLMAVIMGTKIVAPYLWGWIADHRGNRLQIIRIGSVLSVIAFAGIFLGKQYWWMLIIMLSFSFFWNAVLPQYEALTFNYLAKKEHHYSWIRIWGSLGFIFAVIVLGILFNSISISYLPIAILFLLVGIAIATFLISEHHGEPHHDEQTHIIDILKNKQVIVLLVACLLVQIGHGPYYTFYSIYAEAHGYDKSWIGVLWAIGVMSEVVIFALMPYLVKRFGLKNLLLASLLIGSLRWLMIGYAIDNVALTTMAQVFHAATFGVYHAVAIAYIHRYFKGKNQGKGQALYSSVSFGVGGAIGSLYGGYLWDWTAHSTVFTIAALVSFIAFFISWKYTQD